jgi:hypothetical protein
MSRSKRLRSKAVAALFDTPNQIEDAEIQTAKDGRCSPSSVCGYWGAKHIRVSCDIRDARMSMAADLRPDRLDSAILWSGTRIWCGMMNLRGRAGIV